MHFSLGWLVLKRKAKKEHGVQLKPIHRRPRARDTECVCSVSVLQAREDVGLRNWRSIQEGGY